MRAQKTTRNTKVGHFLTWKGSLITNNIRLLILLIATFMQPCRHARATRFVAETANCNCHPLLNLKLLKRRKHRLTSIGPVLVVLKWNPVLQDGIHCVLLSSCRCNREQKVDHWLLDKKRAEWLHADPRGHLLHEKSHPNCDLLQEKTAALQRLSDVDWIQHTKEWTPNNRHHEHCHARICWWIDEQFKHLDVLTFILKVCKEHCCQDDVVDEHESLGPCDFDGDVNCRHSRNGPLQSFPSIEDCHVWSD